MRCSLVSPSVGICLPVTVPALVHRGSSDRGLKSLRVQCTLRPQTEKQQHGAKPLVMVRDHLQTDAGSLMDSAAVQDSD